MLSNLYKINWLFIFLILVLTFIGFMALYSAAGANFDLWAKKQALKFSISFVLLFIIAFIDMRIWFKYAYQIFALSLLLLFSVEIFGTFGLGARRWIKIFNISIQPSELVKVTLILFLAKYYQNLRYDRIHLKMELIIPIISVILPCFLVLIQPDLGTAVLIFLLGVIIIFLAGIRIWKFMLSFIIGVIMMPIMWIYVLKDYQKLRLKSFLNPELDPLGTGYHLIQSKIALGSGGLYGKGFLKGTQAYLNYLPEKQTDFIFTLIGEEFGFIGTIFILLLYIVMIAICFYISFKSFSKFGRLVSLGIGTNLFLYVIFNTAMVTGLMPVVGVPLPLLSYGGSVMFSVMISFGLLMNTNIYNYQDKILRND